MKNKQDNHKLNQNNRADEKASFFESAIELLGEMREIVFELLAIGIGACVSFVLPKWISNDILTALCYIASFLIVIIPIALFEVLGIKQKRRLKKNIKQYGDISNDIFDRRLDYLLSLGFEKEISTNRFSRSVTYTYNGARFVMLSFDEGRIDCFIGLSGQKPERLVASGMTPSDSDRSAFDEEYAAANNMHRLEMVTELVMSDSELMSFLID